MSKRALTVVTFSSALMLGLYGCPQPSPSACENMDASATMQIGSGNPNNPTQYRALSSGDTVMMVPGNQGGQHVWVQLHAEGICAEHPQTRLVVHRASDDFVVGFSQFAGSSWTEVPGAPGTFTSAPMAAAIDEDQYCALVNGGSIRIAVTLDDRSGHMLSGDVVLTIDGWTSDASPFERMSREQCCADYTNSGCWPNGPPMDTVTTDASEE